MKLGRVTKSNKELQGAIMLIAQLFAAGQTKSEIKAQIREKWPISARQFEVWCSRAYLWLKEGEGHTPATVVRAVLDEQCRKMLRDPGTSGIIKVKVLDLWARASGIIATGGINVNVGTQVQVNGANGKRSAIDWKSLAQLQDASLRATSGGTIELQPVTPNVPLLPSVPAKVIDCGDVPTICSVPSATANVSAPQVTQAPDTKPQAQ